MQLRLTESYCSLPQSSDRSLEPGSLRGGQKRKRDQLCSEEEEEEEEENEDVESTAIPPWTCLISAEQAENEMALKH